MNLQSFSLGSLGEACWPRLRRLLDVVLLWLATALLGCNVSDDDVKPPAVPEPTPAPVPVADPLPRLRPKSCFDGSASCWEGRLVYQLLTDRYASADADISKCSGDGYCGGNWRGIIQQLDYIAKLGAEAIWISPVFKNAYNGYRGFWPISVTTFNEHFGTAKDFKDLVGECHKRGLLVMVGVTLNSMGHYWSDIPSMDPPFNSETAFHDCSLCKAPSSSCSENYCSCRIDTFDLSTERGREASDYCQRAGLPDLNTSNPNVSEQLAKSTDMLIKTYGVDGLYLDAAPYIDQDWLRRFVKERNVFALAQIDGSDANIITRNMLRLLKNSSTKVAHAGVNYPLYDTLVECILNRGDMRKLMHMQMEQARLFGRHVRLFGNVFRGSNTSPPDSLLHKAMLIYVLAAEGMPVIISGAAEQGTGEDYVGGGPPNSHTLASLSIPLADELAEHVSNVTYLRLLEVVEFSKGTKFNKWGQLNFSHAPQKWIYADKHLAIFSRGQVVVAISNLGSQAAGPGPQVHVANVSHVWEDDVEVCNLFWPSSDCMTIVDGTLAIYLQFGECKIFAPAAVMPRSTYPCRERECWRDKVIYQVITDRFARSDDGTDDTSEGCFDWKSYCGGTFAGLETRLDYLQTLGVEAIWISPIFKNVPKGYRGHWPMSMSRVNDFFGDVSTLRRLVGEAHTRGMLVMTDVTVNSMGHMWYDIPRMDPPFNNLSFYHKCNRCHAAGGGKGFVGCNKVGCSCWITDWGNYEQDLYCQLHGMPDLDQDSPEVARALIDSVKWLVETFDIDGIRLDALPHVAKKFWKYFTTASGVFSTAEVVTEDMDQLYSYIDTTSGVADAALNFPMYYQLLSCFGEMQPLHNIADMVDQQYDLLDSDVHLQGLFLESLHTDRLPVAVHDEQRRRNMIVYMLTGVGMPIIMYGMEQSFNQSEAEKKNWDNDSRTPPYWEKSGYDLNGETAQLFQTITRLRKMVSDQNFTKAEQVHLAGHRNRDRPDLYVFCRGLIVVAITNVGTTDDILMREVDVSAANWRDGEPRCNILKAGMYCERVLPSDGKVTITISKGEPVILAPWNFASRFTTNVTAAAVVENADVASQRLSLASEAVPVPAQRGHESNWTALWA